MMGYKANKIPEDSSKVHTLVAMWGSKLGLEENTVLAF